MFLFGKKRSATTVIDHLAISPKQVAIPYTHLRAHKSTQELASYASRKAEEALRDIHAHKQVHSLRSRYEAVDVVSLKEQLAIFGSYISELKGRCDELEETNVRKSQEIQRLSDRIGQLVTDIDELRNRSSKELHLFEEQCEMAIEKLEDRVDQVSYSNAIDYLNSLTPEARRELLLGHKEETPLSRALEEQVKTLAREEPTNVY